MFEWSDARIFLAIQRSGSLSAAARQLRVEQSTVGRRLSALETALGTHLFDRTSTGLVPTEAAAAVARRFEAMEGEALAAEREIGGRETQLSGVVRLTAPEILGSELATPLLVKFHRMHPEIELEMVADNRNLNLSRREADLALRLARPTQLGLLTRQVAEVGSGLYASREYVRQRGRLRGGSLRGHDIILYDETYQPAPETQWYAQHARQGRVVLRSNTSRVFLAAVRAGLGVSILPGYYARQYPDLVQLLPPEKVVIRTLWLVIHKDMKRAARVRALADFLVEELRKLPGLTPLPSAPTATSRR